MPTVRALAPLPVFALLALAACTPSRSTRPRGSPPPDAADAGEVDLGTPGDDAGEPPPPPPPPPVDAGAPDLGAPAPTGLDCERDDLHRYACCVVDAVNAYRAETDPTLAPYVPDPALAAVGFSYAGYMAERRVFAHSADGLSFGARLDGAGVRWASAGENLQRNTLPDWRAACAETVRGAGGWARSASGHREAMLGMDARGTPKGWTHAGAGVARRGSEWYVAMYFVRY